MAIVPDMSAKRAGAKQPLSFGQQRICFLEHMHPGSGVNHISIPMRLTGHWTNRRSTRVSNASSGAMPCFRTAFAVVGGEAYQQIAGWKPRLFDMAL